MATVESAERLVSLPPVIETRLQDVRRRESRLRLFTGLIDATALFLFVMLAALVCDWAFTLFSTQVRLLLSLGTVIAGGVGLLLLALLPSFKRRSLAEVAADVDRSVSALQERWQTVAELSSSKDASQVVGSPAMARRVVREAIAREKLVDSRNIVKTDTLKKHQWFLVAAIASIVLLFVIDAPQAWVLLQRFVRPTANVSLTQVTAVKGDFAVPHGEPVRLEAKVARRNHESAELFLRDASGKVSTITLAATDKAGSHFAYPIDSVDKGFEYRFRAGDGETNWHAVTVHERPTFSKIDFRITSPEYTKLPVVEKNELPRKIRAVEASELEIVFTADQPLDQFRLDFGKDSSTGLEPSATNPQQYLYRTTLDKTIRLTPVMTSKHGLENLRPPSCQIVVYQDRAPQVRVVTPENEITVRPEEEVTIELEARDDFAVMEAELITYVGEAPDMENAVVIDAPAETTIAPEAAQNAPATDGKTMPESAAAPEGQTTEAQQDAAQPNSTTPQTEGQAEPGKDAPPADGKEGNSTNTEKPSDANANADSQTQNAKPSDSDSNPAANDSKPSAQPGDPNADTTKAIDGVKITPTPSTDSPNSPSQSNPSQPSNANVKERQPANANSPGDNKPGDSKPGDDKPGMDSANGNAKEQLNKNANPPQTVVTRIPLGEQKGGKSVKAKVKLDLKQFQLKTGQQVQYKIRVVDSKNASAQNRAQRGTNDQMASQDRAAQNNGENGQPRNPADANNAQANAGDNAQQPSANGQTPNNAKGANSSNNANESTKSRDAQANAKTMQPNGGAANNNNNNNNNNNDPNQAKNGNNNPNSNGQNQANSQNPQNANDPANPGSAQNGNNSPNNQNNNSSESTANNSSQQASKSSDQQKPSEGSMTGAQPNNPMTRRQLDVEQQSSSSSTMKIHIDEYAGNFKGQQREKLEILIDPILKELDAVLAKSLEHMAPPSESLKQGQPLDEESNKLLKAAETQIERGQTLVADLVKRTNDTPYAFVGLQLVDITELHVAPARAELKQVATDAAAKQQEHVNQSQFHVIRAREMLANLTKKYEEAKQNAKLADRMERIRKMYQVFVEDSMAFMQSSRETLNPKNRKIAELELDDEFLEKYTELQKQWNEILKELAKALADDPRLLERYMNANRRSAMTLRDQLTVINRRQQQLLPVTGRLIGDDGAAAKDNSEKKDDADAKSNDKKNDDNEKKEKLAAADIVRGSLQQELTEVAEKAAEIQEDLKTWLPKAIAADDARVAPVLMQSTQFAATAGQAAAAAQLKSLEAASKKVADMTAQMAEFEKGLQKLSEDSDAGLSANANRRLAAVRRLQQRTQSWTEKHTHLNEGNLNRAIELDQHRLSEDTLELAGKLDGLQAQLGPVPQDILELAGTLQETLRFDALVDEMQAELTLRDNDLPVARDHQQNAVRNLTRAEETFDKLIDRVIEEGDKVPPDVPDIDQMQLQTLEELLAQLENEQDLAEALGIPQRPTNLQQLRDWMMRNSGASGAGSNGAQRAEMARQNALRAFQNANIPEGAQLSNKKATRWNTLTSRLEDILRQGRGKMPPKQYQRAIDNYFRDISGAEGVAEEETPKK